MLSGTAHMVHLAHFTACAHSCPRREALSAYQEALSYAPNNPVAQQRCDYCKGKVERMSTTML